VNAVATDSKGYLLLGTQAGIARFDGMRFTPFEHFSGMWIYSLLTASDGTLWVGGYQRGLHAVRRDGSLQSWGHDDGIHEGTVYSLHEDRAHRIWLVSPLGLMRMEDGKPRMIVPGRGTGGYAWQSLTEDDSGAIWFAAQDGVSRVSPSGEVTKMALNGVTGQPATIYYSSVKRQFYLGTSAQLHALRCGATTCDGSAIPKVIGPVVGARVTQDGSLWVATWGHGLYRIQSGLVEQLSTKEGLADDFVRVLSEDSEHNLWAGTRSGGLTRLRQSIFKPIGIPEGLGGNYASAVLGDGADGLWLGTWRSGLFHWRDGVMTPQPLPEQPLGVLINALALDSSRNLWIGTFQGLWKLRAGAGVAERVRLPNGNGNVTNLLAARDGTFWVAKRGADLLEFQSGKHFLPGETITALYEDRAGRIWVGSRNGIWRMSGTAARTIEHLDQGVVTALAEDAAGRVWSATDDGAVRVHAAQRAVDVRFNGLPAPVYAIATDAQSGIWFGTGRGVARASMADVEQYLAGRTAPVDVVTYGIPEGMRTIEVRVGAEPSSWRRKDGTIWLPTAKGFVEIDPSRTELAEPPRAAIEQLQVDGKAQSGEIRLPPGSHELAASFTAVRLGRGERLQFRYRMEGMDQDWVDAGGERVARYSHLRPGQFRLLVSARDPGGEWSEAVSSVAIDQMPFWYQTAWFRGLAVLAIGGLVALLYRLRVHAVRKRYAAVLGERNRIAREWHDTLLAGLSAASWQLDLGANECKDSAALPNVQSALGMVRYCRHEARRAIGDLRDEPAAPMTLAESLRESIAQLTSGSAIQSRVEVEAELPSCGSELNSDLLRICQEATANALRHAEASELIVKAGCRDGNIWVSVQDNGIGMDAKAIDHPPHGHYGLLGMRERAQRFGGDLYLSSEPGRGTLVRAVVPLPS
jgi:signal transduction histidine kinase/ligand-binding sensor domain-containing protein